MGLVIGGDCYFPTGWSSGDFDFKKNVDALDTWFLLVGVYVELGCVY